MCWAARDPILLYTRRLEAAGIIQPGDLVRLKREAEAIVEEQARGDRRAVADGAQAGAGVFANEPPRHTSRSWIPGPAKPDATSARVSSSLDRSDESSATPVASGFSRTTQVESAPPFDPKGRTLLDAVMLRSATRCAPIPRLSLRRRRWRRVRHAFLLLRPLLKEFGDRIINSPLAEGAVLGVCVGAALAGQRPIGEIQFNDFVATGFNQLVNNAAKIRYRWGGAATGVPMVVRCRLAGCATPVHAIRRTPNPGSIAPPA
jgi:hypothetical protein